MLDLSQECNLTATQLLQEASANGYKDNWGQVAIAAGLFQVAAAAYELRVLLAWALEQSNEDGHLSRPRRR